MAEIVLAETDTHKDVARALLDLADSPDDVVWAPRPDVPLGGVYVVPDELAAAYGTAGSRRAKRGRRSAATTEETPTTEAGTPAAEDTETAA